MTDKKGFDTYFGERSVLTGAQPVAGDEVLALRAGTVFRGSLTYNKALAVLNNNTDETIINTVDVWEQITGTWVQSYATPGFSFATGQFTYAGTDQIEPALLVANVTAIKILTQIVKVEAAVFVNDALIGSGVGISVDHQRHMNVSAYAIHPLVTGDVIDVRIRNRGDTQAITVSDAQLVISQ